MEKEKTNEIKENAMTGCEQRVSDRIAEKKISKEDAEKEIAGEKVKEETGYNAYLTWLYPN